MIHTIAFDADDTLWHNETAYREAAARLEQLLADHYGLSDIEGQIYATEKNNLAFFGYGVKSYTISMIETAVRLTDSRIEAKHVMEIIDFGRKMLSTDVQLMDGAEETVSELAGSYPLMLITKGDRFEQERKIIRSGLASYFSHIEIVTEKTSDIYAAILEMCEIDPAGFLMVGNSLRSDVIPVVELGGQAVYIHNDLTWEHENLVEEPLADDQYHQIENLGQLPALVRELDGL